MEIINKYEKDGYEITEYDNGVIEEKLIGVESQLKDEFFEETYLSEQEIIQAEILKNQMVLEEKLEEQGIILAELLLNSLGGDENE